MLEDLKKYQNLWTPQYFLELIWLFSIQTRWKEKDLRDHFYNRIIDSVNVFDWGLDLLLHLWIFVRKSHYFQIWDAFTNIIEIREANKISSLIVQEIFNWDFFDETILDFFAPHFVNYNITTWKIELSNEAFDFKYANFKHLLISLNFLIINPENKFKYIINVHYEKLIKEKNIIAVARKKIDLETLKKQLEDQQAAWEEAELFVLEFENRRLLWKEGILQISNIDVCAGFDILSFNSDGSKIPDRFIEVKSCSDKPSFFWSRNEIEIAKKNKNNYYLYLVNRNKIHEEAYSPEIIKNPYESVLMSNDWIKEPEKYHIIRI